jgi:hypothetical protein
MTLESCGHSCIANPGFIGEERARPLRAALGLSAPAGDRARASARANHNRDAARAAKSTAAARPPAAPPARASLGASD